MCPQSSSVNIEFPCTVLFTDINTVQYIFLQYIIFLLYPIIVFSNAVVGATEEEAAAGSNDNDNNSNNNDDDKYAAVAADWEDDECRCRQFIKTTINLSSRRWQRCQGGEVADGETTQWRTADNGQWILTADNDGDR